MSTTSFVMPNDLSDLCRVCLQLPEESQYLDLTTIYDEDDNLTYGECFTICTQIDLSAGVGVPHNLCKTCGLELQMSYDFHKKIEESKRVIEQCQRQIAQEKECSKEILLQTNEDSHKLVNAEEVETDNGLQQFIDHKYVISEDEMEMVGTSQELEAVESIRQQQQHKDLYEYENDLEEQTDDIEVLNKMCQNDASTSTGDGTANEGNIEEHNRAEDDVEHLDVVDFQNMEALEEEAKIIYNPLTRTTINNNLDLQDVVYINRPDFSANIQKYEQILTEETVIEEEISQDATDKWLDTLNDIETQSIPNSDDFPNTEDIKEEISQYNNKELNNILNESVQLNDKELKIPIEQPNSNQETLQDNLYSLSKMKKSTVCLICNKCFVSHNKLSWHMRMHDKNRKRYVCPVEKCGRIYASKQACDLHYRQTHLDEGVICPVCHKIFSFRQTLEVHMRYHTRDFPFQCNLCDRKFAQKGHLTQHVEVKHHNLRYICTEEGCGKAFQNSVSLRNHRYTHSSMPFKCNRCDKEFPQKNKLRAHLWHKHEVELSLDDLECMRQFNIIKTRHAYVKVQTETVKDTINTVQSEGPTLSLECEDSEIDVITY